MALDDPLLSRSGNSCPLGKLTAEAKTKLDEETHELAERKAKALGMSISEWLRDLVIVNVRGEGFLRSLYARRVDAVSKKGHE